MAITNTPLFAQTVRTDFLTFNSDTPSGNVFVAGANGSKVESIMVSSTDSSIQYMYMYITDNNVVVAILGKIPIPANAGRTNSIPAVNVLQSNQLSGLTLDNNGNPILLIASGYMLSISSALTFGAAYNIFVYGGDF